MDVNNIANILLGTLQAHTQKASEDALNRAEQANFPEYLKALATILADPNPNRFNPMAVRMAGITLKNNFFDSRSEAALKRKYYAWNTLVPEPTKQFIRDCVLQALKSPIEDARKSAAQVVGALGVLEIGERRWPELITTLYTNTTAPDVPDAIKVYSLEAMGFLCETLNSNLVSESMTNNLLTAIVENMKPNKNNIVRLAAVRALYNTLDFASANMNRDLERDYIVTNICECARANTEDIRCAAFDCLCQLGGLYYHLLSSQYMEAVYALTLMAVKSAGSLAMNSPNYKEAEKVALHAIEFWNTLCEHELDLAAEMQHAQSSGLQMDPTRVSKRFIHKAMSPLIDLITSFCLNKQSEELSDDEDDWTLAMAGSTLLGLIAQCEPDTIVNAIMPFVQKNLPTLGPNNWRQREAGLMAFGKCLDGPDSRQLSPFVREGLAFFLSLLDPTKETIPQVRDSATWVVGQVCDLHIETIIDELPRVVSALIAVLGDPQPIVAAKSAEAIQYLATSFRDEATEPTNKLSPFLSQLLPSLVKATERRDWNEGELRGLCFEAINAVVESSASDGFPILSSLLEEIIRKLNVAVQAPANSGVERDEIQGMIQYCCGTMLVIIQRLRSNIQPHANTIMTLLVRIVENLSNGAVLSDAHLAIGAVANALGVSFTTYYKAVVPCVLRGIANSDDYQTCQTATELVSDFSRAINKGVLEDSPMFIALMLKNLANDDINRNIKPTTLSALADLALALGPKFETFAEPVLVPLDAATQLTVPRDDPDMVEYLNEVREAVMEAYTAIINALRGQVAMRVFYEARVDCILNFLVTVCTEAALPDSDVTEDVVKGAVGLIGDLCTLGPHVRQKAFTAYQAFKPAIDICLASDDDDVKAVGQFCLKQLSGGR